MSNRRVIRRGNVRFFCFYFVLLLAEATTLVTLAVIGHSQIVKGQIKMTLKRGEKLINNGNKLHCLTQSVSMKDVNLLLTEMGVRGGMNRRRCSGKFQSQSRHADKKKKHVPRPVDHLNLFIFTVLLTPTNGERAEADGGG